MLWWISANPILSDPASYVLGYISLIVATSSEEISIFLYLAWLRPYNVQFGVSMLKKCIEKLKRVLWRWSWALFYGQEEATAMKEPSCSQMRGSIFDCGWGCLGWTDGEIAWKEGAAALEQSAPASVLEGITAQAAWSSCRWKVRLETFRGPSGQHHCECTECSRNRVTLVVLSLSSWWQLLGKKQMHLCFPYHNLMWIGTSLGHTQV